VLLSCRSGGSHLIEVPRQSTAQATCKAKGPRRSGLRAATNQHRRSRPQRVVAMNWTACERGRRAAAGRSDWRPVRGSSAPAPRASPPTSAQARQSLAAGPESPDIGLQGAAVREPPPGSWQAPEGTTSGLSASARRAEHPASSGAAARTDFSSWPNRAAFRHQSGLMAAVAARNCHEAARHCCR